VSGWGRNIDDLAAAAAELLTSGWSPTQPLIDPHAALAARDAVLVELRGLVGAVADAPQFLPVRELTVYDVVHRPAQALHQTLPSCLALCRSAPRSSARSRTRRCRTTSGPGSVPPGRPPRWRATSTAWAGCPTNTPGTCCAT